MPIPCLVDICKCVRELSCSQTDRQTKRTNERTINSNVRMTPPRLGGVNMYVTGGVSEDKTVPAGFPGDSANHVTKDADALSCQSGEGREDAGCGGGWGQTSTSRAINSFLIDGRRCAPRDQRNVTVADGSDQLHGSSVGRRLLLFRAITAPISRRLVTSDRARSL